MSHFLTRILVAAIAIAGLAACGKSSGGAGSGGSGGVDDNPPPNPIAAKVLNKVTEAATLPSLGDKKSSQYVMPLQIAPNQYCSYNIAETAEVAAIDLHTINVFYQRASTPQKTNADVCPAVHPDLVPTQTYRASLQSYFESKMKTIRAAIDPVDYQRRNKWVSSAEIVDNKEMTYHNARVQLVKMKVIDKHGAIYNRESYISLDSQFLGVIDFFTRRESDAQLESYSVLANFSVHNPQIEYKGTSPAPVAPTPNPTPTAAPPTEPAPMQVP
jgi:hypothetical protein